MKKILILGVLSLAACSYPQSQATTVDTRPHLCIANAPADALLSVDGVALGSAAAYAPGVRELALDHGTHRVTVTENGKVLFDNSVYLGDGANSTVTLPQ
jgi:hypothetical protein